ncbi:hypothetical protein CYY_004744 [Polysphondylium violaceum]|uniref:Uncharacterized protein n=1 Tax=Polysphondylium violaceum TaxID=133409 RepID=A0A8J4PUN3_9MYCE|nr:hypothetical protein CYY_004744 [Polysphondylium violaceum]
MREITNYIPFVIQGDTFETILAPIGHPQMVQLVFPFESKQWMRYKIYGKNGALQIIESGPNAQPPIGPSKLFPVDEFSFWISIDIYKRDEHNFVETVKIKRSSVMGYRVIFLMNQY